MKEITDDQMKKLIDDSLYFFKTAQYPDYVIQETIEEYTDEHEGYLEDDRLINLDNDFICRFTYGFKNYKELNSVYKIKISAIIEPSLCCSSEDSWDQSEEMTEKINKELSKKTILYFLKS